MSNELSIRDIQLELATTIADISAVRWVTDSAMIRYRPGPAGKEYAYVPNQFAIMELNRLFHGLEGFRLVVFDTDQDGFGREHVLHGSSAADNFLGLLTHQHVIASDIRLTLGCVNH